MEKGQYGAVITLALFALIEIIYGVIRTLTYNGGLGLVVDPNTNKVLPLLEQIKLNYFPAIFPSFLYLVILITIIFISWYFLKDKSKTNKTSDLAIKLLIWAISLFLLVSALDLVLSPPLLQMLPFITEGFGWSLLFISYGFTIIFYILGILSFILLIIGFIKSNKNNRRNWLSF